jgi:hypothetical protein
LYWVYGAAVYTFVNQIPVQRFQKIKSVLHFNYNQTIPFNDDALHKVHPPVNIIKVTLCVLIRVGSELALDEESVASCSSYGRDVIFFNPMKNHGKFHFRFYVLCCATIFACVPMMVSTKNNSAS